MFKVLEVTVVRATGGTDIISLRIEGPTPFPELDAKEPGAYPPHLKIETRRGYGEEWLKLVGIDPKLVRVIA